MAEQFLNGAQVAAASQQMRREGVTQSMRRRAVGQAKRASHPLHGQLDNPGRQRPSARADEQRSSGQFERAKG